MKVITSFTLNWDLEVVQEESYEYEGPVALCGGSNTSGQHYDELNRLYGIQADQADFLMGVAKNNVIPAYQDFLQQSKDYGSIANQEQAARQAGADSAATSGAARAQTSQDLASMGINPNDERYARTFGAMDQSAAGQQAAAMSGARENTRQLGLARAQDAIALGMGTPTQASAAAQGATQAAIGGANLYSQDRAANAQGFGNFVRGGFNLYNASQGGPAAGGANWFGADGGIVRRYEGGGYVQKYGMGGIIRMGSTDTPPAPPAGGGGAPAPSRAAQAGNAMSMAAMAYRPGEQLAAKGADLMYPGANVGPPAAGTTPPGGYQQLYQAAKSKIDELLPQPAAAAPQAGADAAAATTTAAATDAATAATAADTAAAAAPTVAEAAAEALPFFLPFADGGITRTSGGQVDGPGGPKDDLVPAMLSDGEFIMPVGTVKKFGVDRLEKMRQQGLEFEKQLGIQKPPQRAAAGVR